MKVYGSRVSYYTGKLEAYLRYKGYAYSREKMPYNDPERLTKHVGALQHPIVERDDGRWMSDTTPILLQLEKERPEHSVLPGDPAVRFIALLIEDYADEYLWRSAMHYRWSFRLSRLLLSEILTEELRGHSIRVPEFVKKRMVTRRQRHHFVERDGVTKSTWGNVEQGYLNALAGMSAMLQDRRFMLGDAPSIADYGLMAPMFRHFSQDPLPAEIMRTDAPLVYAWVARMWAAKPNDKSGFLSDVPADAAPLLQEICETHLEQLAANASAFAAGQASFEMTVQDCHYVEMPISRYRVWCLEKLRARFRDLDRADQQKVQALLPFDQAALLWSDEIPAKSDYDPDDHLPFGKAINVYGSGTP